jgi:RNA polymerase sigma factor (sigma-70 family)
MLDLVQEGNCGLAHGIKKFDPERGYALSTYVYWWIRQSVTRYLSCNDRVIRLPSHAVEMLSKLRIWAPEFQNTHGRPPTLEECAELCKTSPDRLQMYMDNANDSISLDSRVLSTDSETSLIDTVTDGEDLMDKLVLSVRADYISSMLARLDEVDRHLVVSHFALNGGEPQTLQALGKYLGVSREAARQRLNKAMRKLRVLSTRCSAI